MRRLLLVLTILVGLLSVGRVLTSGVHGWDYDVYCRSARAIEAGLDPYDTRAVASLGRTPPPIGGTVLTFSYPQATLLALGPLCALPAVLYPLVFTAALVLASWLLRRIIGTQWLLWSALLTSGLVAVAWNYLTGNTGILELLALTPVALALAGGPAGWAGIWIGVAAAVKLSPLIFAALGCAVMARHGRQRAVVSFVAGVAAAVIAVHALSFWLSPPHYVSYLRALAGVIPGQHAAIAETGAGWANPALVLVVKDVLGRAGLDGVPLVGVEIVLLAAGGGLLLVLWRRLPDPLALWAYGALIACLVLPRVKPYTYTYAVVALFLLLRKRPASVQGAVVAVSALLPTLIFLEHWRSFAAGRIPDVLAQSVQPLALLAALVVLLVTEGLGAAKGPDPSGAGLAGGRASAG